MEGNNLKPVYKAWHVFEIESPEDWATSKKMIRETPMICYVDGLDAKVVTVFVNHAGEFPAANAEEALWDIFGEPCLYMSNSDFQDFIYVWEQFIKIQQEFWFQISKDKMHKINVSLMRKALITMGSYKLLPMKKSSSKDYWNEAKVDEMCRLLEETYEDMQGLNITIWGNNELIVNKLNSAGVHIRTIDSQDAKNKRIDFIESANEADGLIILNDCEKIREMSLQPVLERMRQKLIFDTCYIYEVAEIEKLGARLLYC